jgi:hypothetical protein
MEEEGPRAKKKWWTVSLRVHVVSYGDGYNGSKSFLTASVDPAYVS